VNPEKFGKNLKQILDTLEMTQTELAENAGITQAAISQIISGKREPSLMTICLILRVVPVKFERLVRL
jgi:transcriptional regulator with XRE-family HTH domain